MTKVTKANMFSEARNNLVTFVKAYVDDPLSASAEYRKWIYSRRPKTKSADFNGYPIMVIPSAMIDTSSEKGSYDLKTKKVFWEFEIEIITTDNNYGINGDKGLAHMDTISNSLFEALMNVTKQNTLNTQSLRFESFDTTGVDNELINEQDVYVRTILLSFYNRMRVST